MIIRQAIPSDSPAIDNLLAQLGYPQEDANTIEAINTYQLDSYHLLVAEVHGTVVGFASLHWFDMFHMRGKMGRITAICVMEHARSKGIGRDLLSAAEKLLKNKGCVKVEVTTNLKRTSAHEFYLKNSYTIDSMRYIKQLL